MGGSGTAEGLPGDVVLDAGALIAFERGDRQVSALFRRGVARGSRFIIPATALAQVWRGGARSARLARLIGSTEIDSLGKDRAKDVGIRLGARGRSDIADAHVVCCAIDLGATVVTSDEGDLRALRAAGERLALIAV